MTRTSALPARHHAPGDDTPSTITATEIERRLAEYAEAAQGAFATATEKARASDSRIWAQWCADRDAAIVPAEPATVAAFVDDMAETRKPATVRRYCQTIAQLHKAADLDTPTKSRLVSLALRRMDRAKGTRQDQAQPVTLPAVRRMLAQIADDLDSLDPSTKTGTRRALACHRDRALIALAYFTGLRRSEIVALDVADLDLTPADDSGACAVRIGRSKTDQTGAGSERGLSREVADLLRAFLVHTGAATGPLFVSVNGARLSGIDVARILKKHAAQIGMDPARVSGHSTRVGAAVDRKTIGETSGQIGRALGWKGEAMPNRYGANVDVKQSAARTADKLGSLIE